jgi:Spy/CpxP family protein refolding chaperone
MMKSANRSLRATNERTGGQMRMEYAVIPAALAVVAYSVSAAAGDDSRSHADGTHRSPTRMPHRDPGKTPEEERE